MRGWVVTRAVMDEAGVDDSQPGVHRNGYGGGLKSRFEADPRRRRGLSLIQKPIPAPIPTRNRTSRASTRTKNRRPAGQSNAAPTW